MVAYFRPRLLRSSWVVYVTVPIILAVAQPILTPFQRVFATELMIWTIFALAYNLLFGYAGLISLGHALFFGAGMYGVAFSLIYLNTDSWSALAVALAGTAVLSLVIGFMTIRVRGVYFLLTTLIFAMTFYLVALNNPEITGGSSGLVIKVPPIPVGIGVLDILDPVVNYYFVLAFLALSYFILSRIANSPVGKVLEAIRENEDRARFIGYHVERYKLFAFVVSGIFSGVAGSMYAFSFRFAGPQLMNIVTSVNVLVWTLLGGAGTLLGPVVGTFIMVTAVDVLSSHFASFLILVGAIVVILVLLAPSGIVGAVKSKILEAHG